MRTRKFDEVFAEPVEFECGQAISRRAYTREEAARLLWPDAEPECLARAGAKLRAEWMRWGPCPDAGCEDGGDFGWWVVAEERTHALRGVQPIWGYWPI